MGRCRTVASEVDAEIAVAVEAPPKKSREEILLEVAQRVQDMLQGILVSTPRDPFAELCS